MSVTEEAPGGLRVAQRLAGPREIALCNCQRRLRVIVEVFLGLVVAVLAFSTVLRQNGLFVFVIVL